MQTYSVTCSSTAFETFEVEANSAKEAEQMVEQALNFGDAWTDPQYKYLHSSGSDEWTAVPEYTLPR